MQQVQGVLLDAGNTLIRVRGSVGAVYAAVAERHGIRGDPTVLDKRFRSAFDERKGGLLDATPGPHGPQREKGWWRGIVEDVFRGGGLWTQVEGRFGPLFDDLYETFAHADPWEVFGDVEPCLDALDRMKVPVGVVSNWDSRLRSVLSDLGLTRRFRFVLTSVEFGAEKPDPAIFHEAVRRLGCPAGRVLHVGDLVRDDWQGARAAGLQAVLLDRYGTAPGIEPRIRSLDGLAVLVGARGEVGESGVVPLARRRGYAG